MAMTTKELSLQLEDVTARLRAIEAGQHVMTSSPGLPLEKWSDHGFVHRHEIKPLVRAINNGGGSAGGLEERVEQLESGQNVLTSVTNQQTYEIEVLESGQAVLTSALRNKQDTLIPGSGIDITENVISATGGGGGSSIFDAFMEFVANPTPYTNKEDTHAVRIGSIGNKDVFAISKTVTRNLPGNSAAGGYTDLIKFDVTGYTLTSNTRLIPLMCICYEQGHSNYHNILCPGYLEEGGGMSIGNVTTPKAPQSASYFECTISYINSATSSIQISLVYALLFTLKETS